MAHSSQAFPAAHIRPSGHGKQEEKKEHWTTLSQSNPNYQLREDLEIALEEVADKVKKLEQERPRWGSHSIPTTSCSTTSEGTGSESDKYEENPIVTACRAVLAQDKTPAEHRAEAFLVSHGFKSPVAAKVSCFKLTYPLHVAVRKNDAPTVKALLDTRADVQDRDSKGFTPLQLAQKLNRDGSHQAIIDTLASTSPASRVAAQKAFWNRLGGA